MRQCHWRVIFGFLAIAIMTACWSAPCVADAPVIDWSTVPESRVPEMLSVGLHRLRSQLSKGRFLAVPFNVHRDSARMRDWDFESYASFMLLTIRGETRRETGLVVHGTSAHSAYEVGFRVLQALPSARAVRRAKPTRPPLEGRPIPVACGRA
jgi:hypothetical protein